MKENDLGVLLILMVGSDFVLTLSCNNLDVAFPKLHGMQIRNMYFFFFLGQVDAVISQAKRKTMQKLKSKDGRK